MVPLDTDTERMGGEEDEVSGFVLRAIASYLVHASSCASCRVCVCACENPRVCVCVCVCDCLCLCMFACLFVCQFHSFIYI